MPSNHTKFKKVLVLATKDDSDEEVTIGWNNVIKNHLNASYDDRNPPTIDVKEKVDKKTKDKPIPAPRFLRPIPMQRTITQDLEAEQVSSIFF